jgi:hypothetical protein
MSEINITENNEQILNDIQMLQEMEQKLFNNLETNTNLTTEQKQKVVEKMNQLSDSESNKQDKKSVVSPSSIEKLKLQTVIDSVGFLLFPSSKFVNMAFKELLTEYNLFDFNYNFIKTLI